MCARSETGVMPIRQGTQVGMRCQIRLQPSFLRRTSATTAHLATIRVQGDDVPGADIKAIVTFGRIARRGTEVTVVTAGTSRQIFMVANGRPDDALGSSPAGIKGLLIFRQSPILILRIA